LAFAHFDSSSQGIVFLATLETMCHLSLGVQTHLFFLFVFVVCIKFLILIFFKLFAMLIFIFCFKFLYPATERTSNTLNLKHGLTLELTHVGLSAEAHFTHTHSLHECDRAHIAASSSALPPCTLVCMSIPPTLCTALLEYDRAHLCVIEHTSSKASRDPFLGHFSLYPPHSPPEPYPFSPTILSSPAHLNPPNHHPTFPSPPNHLRTAVAIPITPISTIFPTLPHFS
jgi:hypothetical protein